MLPHRDVPVIVNSFNRFKPLRKLVNWLQGSGYRNLVVVDNASSFGPLLRYLDHLESSGGVRVVRLDENRGHTALWTADVLRRLQVDTEYVYTDPDVVPAASCPADVVRVLQELLLAEPGVFKAGLGLRLDDLPFFYRHRRAVLAWETKYWLRPAAPDLYVAPIDTTFALYRPMSERGVDELAIRTGPPYVASHESWYSTGLLLGREDRHYARHASRNSASTWARLHLPQWLRRWEQSLEELYPLVLLFDEPGATVPGYVNFERLLSGGRGGLDLQDASVDGFYLPQGTSRLRDTNVTFEELRRVAKPGARMVLRLKLHRRDVPENRISEGSDIDAWLAKLPRDVIEGARPARFSSWRLERLQLVLEPSAVAAGPGGRLTGVGSTPLEAVTEQIVHLSASEAAESEPNAAGIRPHLEATSSRLDLHSGFELLASVPPPS